jgi:hypothetical protein
LVTVDDVRELALTLPATTERSSYGTPGFRVKDKLFARIHDNSDWLVLRMDQAQRELMAQAEPEKFFWTPTTRTTPPSSSASAPSTAMSCWSC